MTSRRLLDVVIIVLAFPLCLAGGLRLLPVRPDALAAPRPQSTSTVAIARAADSSPAEVERAVREAIAMTVGVEGLAGVVSPGATCLLKPNLGLGLDAHEITSWQVVRAVALLCQEAGAARVIVGESPERGLTHYSQAGYTANIPGVEFVDLSALSTSLLSVQVANSLWPPGEPLVVPRIYVEADVVISIPKLKTHSTTGMTGALKNQVGVPPLGVYATSSGLGWRDRFHKEYGIHKAIVQISLARRPDLVVMDAVRIGEGMGPWGADPVDLGLILASRDPVAADAVASAVMGLDPRRIRHIVYASAWGLGEDSLSAIDVVGEQIADVAYDVTLPGREHTLFRKAVILAAPPDSLTIDGNLSEWSDRPWSLLGGDPQRCTGGGVAADAPGSSLQAAVAYDAERLYIAAHIMDDLLLPGALSLAGEWMGDALEVYFSGADQDAGGRQPQYLATDRRLGIGQGQDAFIELPSGVPVAGATARAVPIAGGYALEASIPFAALGGYRPSLHDEVGLDLAAVDVDSLGQPPRRHIWSGSCAVLADPREMGVALLAADRTSVAPTPTASSTPRPTTALTGIPMSTSTPTPTPTRAESTLTATPTTLPTWTRSLTPGPRYTLCMPLLYAAK